MAFRWDGSVIHLDSSVTAATPSGQVSFNFRELRVKKNGLLQSVLEAADSQVGYSAMCSFRRILINLSSNTTARKLFSTPIGELYPQDIRRITQHIDKMILSSTFKAQSVMTGSYRRFMLKCRTKLANGQRITHHLLRSKCRDQNQTQGKTPASFEGGTPDVFSDSYLQLPLNAIPFDSLDDRKGKALNHQAHALDTLVNTCVRILDNYDKTANIIKNLKNTPLPYCVSPSLMHALEDQRNLYKKGWTLIPPSECIHVIELLIERYQLYSKPPPAWMEPGICPYLKYKDSQPRERWETLLADYYLTRSALIACLILLILETGWNVSTALDLSLEDITPNEFDGFDLVSLKPKTDQLQEVTVDREPDLDTFIESDAKKITISTDHTIRAINLLIEHRRNLDLYCKPTSRSVFCPMNRHCYTVRYEFEVFTRPGHALKVFCKENGLPHYTFTALRRLAANVEYLRTDGDIFRVQAFLGHASADTTVAYLNSTLIRLLGEANMLRYMKLLETSIVYASPRKHTLSSTQLASLRKTNLLLFPISKFEDTPKECVADAWLKSMGTLRIKMGMTELQHTVLQHRFYKSAIGYLINGNRERFIRCHMPRIVFCAALYRVIASGPYAQVMKNFEASIK